MSSRGKLDEPGYMEMLLRDIDETPREVWLDMLAQYENEKPGDIILPGVPLHVIKKTPAADAPKKPNRKNKKAA